MRLKTIQGVNVRNKRVLLRVDFNVFMKGGAVADDFRIKRSIPTIRYLLKNKAKVIILTHFGRPEEEGKAGLSAKPLARKLENDLGHKVLFAADCVGPKAMRAAQKLKPQEILMLENVRFHKGEERNDESFAGKLAALADLYVNEAFSVCHRAHASVEAITRFLPSYAGFLLAKEVRVLHEAYEKPKLPLVIAMGGAKIETKAKLLKRFFDKANDILLGGMIANFVLRVKGIAIGKSKVDEDGDLKLKELNWTSVKLHLPVDVVVAKEMSATAWLKTKGVGKVEDDEIILDIGPDTVELFSAIAMHAKTIIWNGPLGYFELASFAAGTNEFVKAMAESKAFTIIGGGDSVAVVDALGLRAKMNFVSTGGGAMLDFLAGEPMPGIEALQKSQKLIKSVKSKVKNKTHNIKT
ncbi:phosphoglycerate kinase [Candidatus Azambacteria bacterium RIFCSPLOWO2_01_FULL_46_25]|uniref:Phosphoglycerate kinase n=1 Tax=Candidatus Azambacteria bacterium RIFCSPLOWO2_01_FULL_46_25 TaxID=1797298 RepID=A0A1F5BU42_9BACT|nr:MAG: phosphoglycerate kinase [Candidatus Azambacteria bacterium RIFCSPLOWO2_01_FULL_46_25]OGD36716.1 MAG: phosphoglycerate kinase [Candidatus Azambacteria bacterium RIFCSPHIGHO2_01_FULL_51_74]